MSTSRSDRSRAIAGTRGRWAAGLLAVVLVPLGASAQGPAAQPDDLREAPISDEIEIDPKIEAAVRDLEEHWQLQDGEDSAPRERALQRLVTFADGPLHPRDAERLKLTFQQILERHSDDLPERRVAVRDAILGIARLGRVGIEWLIGFRDVDGIPIRPETQSLRGLVLRQIARSGHEDGARILREVIERSSERELIATAGGALREYKYLEREERQEIVEIMARQLAGLENVTARNPGSPSRFLDLYREDAEDDLMAVFESWKATLAALTGVQQPDGQAWWEWYQEHKSKPWPQDEAAEEWRAEQRRKAGEAAGGERGEGDRDAGDRGAGGGRGGTAC